jgi:hypothetical protein
MEYYHTDNKYDEDQLDTDTDIDSDIERPEWAICPLTLEVMNDPLMDRDGLTYERKAIVGWLNRGHTTCPLTRKPLTYRMLAPNAQLKVKIDDWKRLHNLPISAPQKEHDQEDCNFSILLEPSMEMDEASLVYQLLEQRAAAAIAALNQRRQQQRQHRRRRLPGRLARRRSTSNQNHGAAANANDANANDNNNNTDSDPSLQSRRRRVLSILDTALSVVKRGDRNE